MASRPWYFERSGGWADILARQECGGWQACGENLYRFRHSIAVVWFGRELHFCGSQIHGRSLERPRSNQDVSGLVHFLDFTGPPCLVEPWFERAIQAQKGVPPLPGYGLHPVVLLACRCFGPEIDIH